MPSDASMMGSRYAIISADSSTHTFHTSMSHLYEA